MTDGSSDVSRRGFLRAATAGGVATAATGSAAAQSGNESDGNQTGGNQTGGNQTGGNQTGGNQTGGNQTGGNQTDGGGGGAPEPDYGTWFSDVSNFDGIEDLRGQDQVTVEVGVEGNTGFYAFGPAAVHISPGTTVVWEWTGEGGAHDVVDQEGAFESDQVAEAGFTYERTFEEDGMWRYYCNPHQSFGMKGAVVVGTDYPSVDTGGSAGPQPLPDSAKTIGIATSFVMVATLGLAYFFMKYGGDYGDVGQ